MVSYPICLHGNVAITFNTPAIYYFYCVRIDAKWLLPNVFSFVYICIYLQKSKHKRLSPPACLFDSLWQCYGANKRCVTNESRTKLIVLVGIHLRISCVLAKQRQRRANHICGISHVLFFHVHPRDALELFVKNCRCVCTLSPNSVRFCKLAVQPTVYFSFVIRFSSVNTKLNEFFALSSWVSIWLERRRFKTMRCGVCANFYGLTDLTVL